MEPRISRYEPRDWAHEIQEMKVNKSIYVPDSDNRGESLGVIIVLKVFALTFISFACCYIV